MNRTVGRVRLRVERVFVALILGFSTAASARSLAEVNALGAISMCANPEALPYASNRAEQPGFQIEIGRAIADGLGLRLTIEWILPRRRANVVNCDMLFDSIADPGALAEAGIQLSRPYHRSGVALGLRDDAEDVTDFRQLKEGQKIGTMISSVASMVLGKAGKTISPYAFQADMLEDLRNGVLYGAVVSAATLSYYVRQHPNSGLKLVNAFDDELQLSWFVAVGLRKADALLVDAVNTTIEKLLADGTISRIYAKYGITHRPPP